MGKTENKRNKRISDFYMIMYFVVFGCSYFAVCVFGNMKISVLSTIMVLVGISGYILFEPLLLRKFNRKIGIIHLIISGLFGTSILVFVNAFSVVSRVKSVFIFLILFGVLIAVFTFFSVLIIKRTQKKKRRKAKAFRFIQILITLLSLAGIVLFFTANDAIENVERLNVAADENMMLSTVEATNNADVKDDSLIKAYLSELVPLVDGTYKELTTQEKLDILQIICNIESTYNGNSKGNLIVLKSLFSNDEVCTKGCFSNSNEMIYLNSDVFDDMSEFEALRVTLHECFHAKQYEQIKILKALPEELKDNALLYETKLYAKEFNNYMSCENGDSFEEYEEQYVERTADSYAYYSAQEYINLIKQYSGEKCYK